MSGKDCRLNNGCAYYPQESKPDEKQKKFKEIAANLNKKVWNMRNKMRISFFAIP